MAYKRKQYTIEAKYQTIKQVENSVQKKVVAEDFGISAHGLSRKTPPRLHMNLAPYNFVQMVWEHEFTTPSG